MIIAQFFFRLLTGATIANPTGSGTIPVAFHYGDQKELIRWIARRGNERKFPLIWYVISSTTENAFWYHVPNARFVILADTRPEVLNTERNVKYTDYITPTWHVLRNAIEGSRYVINVASTLQNRYSIKDEPNYAVDTNHQKNDYVKNQTIGERSISPYVVDGRIIDMNIRVNPSCIIIN